MASPEAVALIWGKKRLTLEAINHIAAYCSVLFGPVGLVISGSTGVVYAQGKTWLPTLLGSLLVLCFYPLYEFMSGSWAQDLSTWLSQNSFNIGLGFGLALCSSLAISAYVCCLWLALCFSFSQSVSAFYKFLGQLFKIEFAVLLSILCLRQIYHYEIFNESTYMKLLLAASIKTILFQLSLFCFVIFSEYMK